MSLSVPELTLLCSSLLFSLKNRVCWFKLLFSVPDKTEVIEVIFLHFYRWKLKRQKKGVLLD